MWTDRKAEFRLAKRTYPYTVSTTRRVTTDYYYDGMSRLTRMLDRKGGNATVLMDKVYGYDAANRIASVTEPTRTRTYAYDDLDRLTGVTDTQPGGNESYAYDAVGNRTSSHRSASYGYGLFNRLTSTATATYTYDANGAMTTRTDASGTMNFTHDADGRLVAAYTGAMQFAEYYHDALGRRVRVAEPSGVPLRYTYDGHDAVAVRQEGSSVVTQHVYAPGVDRKIATRLPGSAWQEFMLQDHLGTTTAGSTPGGVVTNRPAADAFGNGPGADFTGREQDSFTGLYYYRARMYDPQLGRFTSEDPIGFKGKDINLYAYARNNPVSFKDPSGKIWVYVIAGGVIAAEGGIHLYLGERASSINWPGGDPWGRAKHCYVNCMSTRIHLGGVGPSAVAGLSQEAVNWGQGAPIDDIAGDLNANFDGQRKALIFWKSCEELCRTCQ